MLNLQIGDNDSFGSRFNGHDLHQYLNQKGIISKHLVWKKLLNDDLTFEIADNEQDKYINALIADKEKKYSLHSFLYNNAFNIICNDNFIEADIIHYHLIHNYFLSITHLPILTRLKPTVWTLHDPWALTGHCIYPFDCNLWRTGCEKCSNKDTHFSIKKDTSSLSWEMKKIYYEKSDFDIIVASRWMYNYVKKSPLMHGKEVHLVPFGLDLNKFKPHDNIESKRLFGIPGDSVVICFRNVNSSFKGLENIKNVLRRIKTDKNICLLTFNDKGTLNEFKNKFQLVELGWVTDEKLLISAYNASDIFLMPSTAEAFGMMAMEAMACGKPVVVFKGTALEDTIFAPDGGIAVTYNDNDLLLEKLKLLIENENYRKELGGNALRIAKSEYNSERYVNSILDVYEHVLEKRKNKKERMIFYQIADKSSVCEINQISSNDTALNNYDSLNEFENLLISIIRKFNNSHGIKKLVFNILKLFFKMVVVQK